MKAGRPVKIVYDRVEDMLATTKRHPGVIRHRTGVTKDGRLTAMDIDVLFDGGAYVTLSPVVLSRGVLHATGPYRCPDVRIRGRVTMTNTPPNGAFRGFGAPQTQFAAEVHMERIAEALGMDPVRLREVNAFRPGDTTATGQRLGKDCSALAVLREAVKRSDFQRRRRELAGTNRGIGLALFFHGSGFTGGGEVKLASKASLELTEHGRAHPSSRQPRSARGRARCTRRSSRTRSGFPTTTSRSPRPTPRRFPTAARPSRPAPAWSSARSWSAAPREISAAARQDDAARILDEARPARRHEGIREAGGI